MFIRRVWRRICAVMTYVMLCTSTPTRQSIPAHLRTTEPHTQSLLRTSARPRSSHTRRVRKAAPPCWCRPVRCTMHETGAPQTCCTSTPPARQSIPAHLRTTEPHMQSPIRRAPYARRRAHAVRTRGVCAKPRRHAGAVRPCAHCITALTLQGSHLSAARHRVALSLYQSHDRDLRSMLEAEPARRRGHQCLHWSSPHRRWWCWWRWCRRRR